VTKLCRGLERTGPLGHRLVYRPDLRYAATTAMDVIRTACWHEEALNIRYTDKAQAVTERMILPLAIIYTDRTLTALAWCCPRDAFRMFRIERIISVDMQGTSFQPRRAALLRTYLAQLRQDDAKPSGPERRHRGL
jgi:predicted DNA-binding transcriptional regulator YafY